jgi:hypothetical protein
MQPPNKKSTCFIKIRAIYLITIIFKFDRYGVPKKRRVHKSFIYWRILIIYTPN